MVVTFVTCARYILDLHLTRIELALIHILDLHYAQIRHATMHKLELHHTHIGLVPCINCITF